MSDEELKADASNIVLVYPVALSREAYDILKPFIRLSPREVAKRLLESDTYVDGLAAKLAALEEQS